MQGSIGGTGVCFQLTVVLAEPTSWFLAKLIAKINDGTTDSRTQVRSAH